MDMLVLKEHDDGGTVDMSDENGKRLTCYAEGIISGYMMFKGS